MTPSLASRPAFLEAEAAPFLRRSVSAATRSPLASTRAFLQSIMPALVLSRSCLTSSGEISLVVDIDFFLSLLNFLTGKQEGDEDMKETGWERTFTPSASFHVFIRFLSSCSNRLA